MRVWYHRPSRSRGVNPTDREKLAKTALVAIDVMVYNCVYVCVTNVCVLCVSECVWVCASPDLILTENKDRDNRGT